MDRQELQEQIKAAMKARDKDRLAILRQVLGEVNNIEVNERRETTSEDVDSMIKRVLKQTNETLEASIKAANNEERTEKLKFQVGVLEDLLPKQIAGEELDALIKQVLDETGASTKKDMGKVMKALGAKTGGNFDKAGAASKLKDILA